MPLLNGRYERKQSIGVGGFGVVEQFEDKVTGHLVAIKTILAKHVNGESLRLLREIDIMLQLSNRHPRVVSVFDVFCTPAGGDGGGAGGQANSQEEKEFDSDEEDAVPQQQDGNKSLSGPADLSQIKIHSGMDFNVHIVMPLMRGDLLRYTRDGLPDFPNRNEFEQAVAVVFAFHLVFGLDYIHKCGIVHRDLKPENILISLDLASPYESKGLIADFGLARDVRSTETFYVCTRHYRPPEVITNSASQALTGIDIWSVGCILFELVTGKFLVRLPTSLNEQGQWEPVRASVQLESMLRIIGTPTPDEVEKYVDATKHGNIRSYLLKTQQRPSKVAELTRNYWRLKGVPVEEQAQWIDLISACVKFFPQQRPTAEQLCCHPLFHRYNVYYGHNIGQYPTSQYEPVKTFNNRADNKGAILRLVEQLGKEARAKADADQMPQHQVQQQPDSQDPQQQLVGDSQDAAGASQGSTTSPQRQVVDETDEEGDSVPPVAGGDARMVQGSTSNIRAPETAFPIDAITDYDLRQRYGSRVYRNSREVQDAIDAVLMELGQQTDSHAGNPGSKTEQLKRLLSYLVAMVPNHSKPEQAQQDDAITNYAALEEE